MVIFFAPIAFAEAATVAGRIVPSNSKNFANSAAVPSSVGISAPPTGSKVTVPDVAANTLFKFTSSAAVIASSLITNEYLFPASN